MEKLLIKHVMDEEPREMSLNEAFMEALQLSQDGSNEFARQEYELYEYCDKYPDFLNKINDDYKRDIILSWDYEIIE